MIKRDTDTRKKERKTEEERHEIDWILVGEKGSMKKRNRKTHTHIERGGGETVRKEERQKRDSENEL
jgi:hypothetical protein